MAMKERLGILVKFEILSLFVDSVDECPSRGLHVLGYIFFLKIVITTLWSEKCGRIDGST